MQTFHLTIGTYKEHGEWAVPVYPSNISLAGSPATPYIYDDRCDPVDVADALLEVYDLSEEERERRGLEGHKWVCSDEAQMTADNMCKNIIKSIDKTFDVFEPRPTYEVFKADKPRSTEITHALTGY